MNDLLKEKNYIFIIGSPRSGTTWLQLLINSHPNVASSLELNTFSSYLSPMINSWKKEEHNYKSGKWNKGLPTLIDDKEFYSYVDDFLGNIYQKVLDKNPGATHLLDKNPANTLHVDLINQLMPNSKFIHIIRDGRDVVVSWKNVKKNIGFGYGSAREGAKVWKDRVLKGQEAKKLEGRYLEVRYEDLLVNGLPTVKGVYDFCGLEYTEESIQKIYTENSFEILKKNNISPDPNINTKEGFYNKGVKGSWTDELNLEEKFLFHVNAWDTLKELGYEEDFNWWSKSGMDRFRMKLKYKLKGNK
jgi:hypothetical protein